MRQIEWGTGAHDCVTGFKGIVTGYAEYDNGCVKYLLEAKSKNNEKPTNEWIDEQRIVIAGKKNISTATAGGPMILPPR